MTRSQIIQSTLASVTRVNNALTHKQSANNYQVESGLVQWFETMEKYVLPGQQGIFGHEVLPETQYLANLLDEVLRIVFNLEAEGNPDTSKALAALNKFSVALNQAIAELPPHKVPDTFYEENVTFVSQ